VKIGPVDTEMALLIVKKEEITEGKIHSPIGRFAERAKLHIIFLPLHCAISLLFLDTVTSFTIVITSLCY